MARAIHVAFFSWSRKAEFSCDRMGLLVCGDVDAALRVMIKLSGFPFTHYPSMSIEAFLDQYQRFEALDGDPTDAIAKVLQSSYLTHPWTVERAHELHCWVTDGDYQRLLNVDRANALQGDNQRRGPHAALPAAEPGRTPALTQANRSSPRAIQPLHALDKPLLFECPACYSVVLPSESACTVCRCPVTERNRYRRCERCGTPGKPSHAFCESCGSAQQADRPTSPQHPAKRLYNE